MKDPVDVRLSEGLASRLHGTTLNRQFTREQFRTGWAKGVIDVSKKEEGIYVVSVQYAGKKSFLSQDDVDRIQVIGEEAKLPFHE